jgi:hypothetical protein
MLIYLLIVPVRYFWCYCSGETETRKQQGKSLLKSVFWIFVLAYESMAVALNLIAWIFECMVALFKPEEEEDERPLESAITRYIHPMPTMEIKPSASKIPELIVAQRNTCSHCGCGRQYNATCDRCGAPIQ